MDRGSDRLVDDKILSKTTRLSRSYWQKKRVSGDGPPYYEVGRRCLYDLDEVIAWIKSHRRSSTSDAA